MKSKKLLSEEELREKVDGFRMDSTHSDKRGTFKTIDAGVYQPPDDVLDKNTEHKE